MTSAGRFPGAFLGRWPIALAASLAAWSLVALLFSIHGYWFGLYAQRPQPWWPSFGYTLSVFSIWAVLTPAIALAVRRVWGRPARLRAVALGLGLPATLAAHAAIFAALFWPIYSSGGRLSPWAMGERMLVSNLHTDVIFYVAVVAGAAMLARRAAIRAPAPVEGLRVRSRGTLRILPLAEVDWIGAAGNYAEARAGGRSVLVDESLAGLDRRLPADRFARIHRQAIVRLDRIAEVRSLGRGDALVRLRDGTELRLSRRYRPALKGWLNGGPAGPPDGPARG